MAKIYTGKVRATRGAKADKPRRDVHAEITKGIVEQLEAGTIPWLKPWKEGTAFAGMPRNFVTKREYSGVNVILLWCAAREKGYHSNEWLTFKQAQEKGGTVRKGEKATTVVFYKRLDIKETADTGEQIDKQIMMAREYHVFNVEQCDGLKLDATPSKAGVSEHELNQAFMRSVRLTGVDLRHGGCSAYYAPELDYVQMPALADFKTAAGYMNTLAHEMVHWTGHKSRLDRFEGPTARTDYAFEELVAELGAAFTCAEFGIKGDLRHASYIKSWIKLLTDDKRALFRAASRASKAVAFLYPNNSQAAVDVAQAA